MKPSYLVILGSLVASACALSSICEAENKVPCLIFSGQADQDQYLDLSSFNRITFGKESMVISSSRDESRKPIEFLYSLYHHFSLRDEIPTDLETSTDLIAENGDSRIYADAKSKTLRIISVSDSKFFVGIFNLSGELLLTSEISNGEAISLQNLNPGVYIAVATDGSTKLNLKFILNN